MTRLPSRVALVATTSFLPLAVLPAQQPDSTSLPPVVITATRVDAPVARDIAAVTVVRGRDLEREGVHTLAEALRTVPGVTIAQSGGPGAQTSLFLRGGESDYVRLLVDGVPVNDPGGAIDLSAIGIGDVDRIEIVRGPASVLYGTDAVTGVVQVFTRGGEGAGASELALDAGSHGERSESVSLGAQAPAADVALSARHSATDGILPFNNAYRADAVNGRAHASVGSTDATLTVRHRADLYHYPTDGAGAVVDRNALRGERRNLASLDLRRPIAPGLQIGVTLASMDVHGHTDDAQDAPDDTLGLFAYRSTGAVRRRSADARLQARLAGQALAVVGVEWMREGQANEDSSNYDVALNRFAAHRSNRAAYVQLTGDRALISWTIGGRYDDNGSFGVFRTARGGLAARPWRGGVLRATVGTAFKAPTFYESEPTAFSVGNGALRPERSRSWELGIRQTLSAWSTTVGVTYFDQRFRDLVQYAFQGPGLPDYFNVAAASARGLEFTAGTAPFSSLRLGSALTLLHTRVDDAGFATGAGDTFVQGAHLLRRPAVTAAFTLSAKPWGGLAMDARVLHEGRRDDRDFSTYPANPVILPSYSRVDIALSYQLGGRGLGGPKLLRARVENLFGAHYDEVAGFAAPGRTVGVGVTLGGAR